MNRNFRLLLTTLFLLAAYEFSHAQENSANPVASPTGAPQKVSKLEDVIELAKSLAEQPFKDSSKVALGKEWTGLSYEDYHKINFRPENSLMRGASRFEVQFFHPGFLYERSVDFSVVEDSNVRRIDFEPSHFEYHLPQGVPPLPKEVGFAGFRVLYPLHSLKYKDEALFFLGASKFKFLGRRQRYGLSARGLAVDTALPKGEEYPFFKEFWMLRPAPGSNVLHILALLDSKSLTGAYSFTLHPGTNSELSVRAVLFLRKPVQKLGMAPLTSMFYFGEDRTRLIDDFRPEVHDSDGLLLRTGKGEWLWRPLVNRERLSMSSFLDENPKGFGLLQRDRSFNSYQDLQAHFHARPSYWVEPKGDWGKGHVELVEIPTDSDTNDNIVAYWVPEQPPTPGAPYEFSYSLFSYLNDDLVPGARTTDTRIGARLRSVGQKPDKSAKGRERFFVIDFVGGDFPFMDGEQPVEGIVDSSSGTVKNVLAIKNELTDGWRLTFEFAPEENKPAEFRAFLKLGGDVLTETWNYLWTPQ